MSRQPPFPSGPFPNRPQGGQRQALPTPPGAAAPAHLAGPPPGHAQQHPRRQHPSNDNFVVSMPPDQRLQRSKSAPGTQLNEADAMPLSSIPAPMPRSGLVRKKTVKAIKLTDGNLVIHHPVPDRYLAVVNNTSHEEFNTVRYTAATCDPDNFANERYTLRQSMYGRETELAICMTMYNEDEQLFAKTMTAVMKNIQHLCTRKRSSVWGENAWQRVVVCIVSDGRMKVNKKVLDHLAVMGVYQEGIAKNQVNGKDVQAHIYEFTTQLAVEGNGKVRGPSQGMVPVQIIFCLKEQNKKKINSHRWFLNAFGPVLNPHVVVLLDVGTKPLGNSLYHLWKTFDKDPNVGGACGEIIAEKKGFNILNPLVAAQNFEYKMSNILDKPMESMFGYISVLPGAFSAYRYRALQNYAPNKGPLASYFKGETMHSGDSEGGLFAANMYLAEDRILCFELLAKPNAKWLLRYIKAASAETDVPDTVPEFISQRRRWLNGSFFAAFYAIAHWGRVFTTDHGVIRKFGFLLQVLYNIINIIFGWFSLATFYLAFYFIAQNLTGDTDPFGANSGIGDGIFFGLRYLYLAAIVTIFIMSMGNRPQGSRKLYITCMTIFSLLMLVMLAITGYTVYSTLDRMLNGTNSSSTSNSSLRDTNGSVTFNSFGSALLHNAAFRDLVVSMLSTVGVYLISSLMFMDPWHMITSFGQYMLLLPSFVNILQVYAFCNTNDVSWGTKGDNKTAKDLGVAIAKSSSEVQLEVLDHKADINAAYDAIVYELKKPRQIEAPKKRDAATKQEDYHRTFRTNLVLTWMFSNAIMVCALTSSYLAPFVGGKIGGQSGTQTNYYLAVVFWAVAGLAAVRFFGAFGYQIGRLFKAW